MSRCDGFSTLQYGGEKVSFKILTQTYVRKFGYEVKKLSSRLANAEKWEEEYTAKTSKHRENNQTASS